MTTTDTRPKHVPILLPVWVIERLAKLTIEMQRIGATGVSTADRWAEEAGSILAAISDAQVIESSLLPEETP